MKECLECGYEGNNINFSKGCPMCGNWDSWKIKDKGLLVALMRSLRKTEN